MIRHDSDILNVGGLTGAVSARAGYGLAPRSSGPMGSNTSYTLMISRPTGTRLVEHTKWRFSVHFIVCWCDCRFVVNLCLCAFPLFRSLCVAFSFDDVDTYLLFTSISDECVVHHS